MQCSPRGGASGSGQKSRPGDDESARFDSHAVCGRSAANGDYLAIPEVVIGEALVHPAGVSAVETVVAPPTRSTIGYLERRSTILRSAVPRRCTWPGFGQCAGAWKAATRYSAGIVYNNFPGRAERGAGKTTRAAEAAPALRGGGGGGAKRRSPPRPSGSRSCSGVTRHWSADPGGRGRPELQFSRAVAVDRPGKGQFRTSARNGRRHPRAGASGGHGRAREPPPGRGPAREGECDFAA